MKDDDILVPPLDLKLVMLAHWPPDQEEDKSFLVACTTGHVEEVQRRLLLPQDPNITNEEGRYALHLASENGHPLVVQMLLEAGALHDPTAQDQEDVATPLHLAAYYGHPQVVNLLVAGGAFHDQAMTDTGVTPLLLAAQNGHLEVVRSLLEFRAVPDTATWFCLRIICHVPLWLNPLLHGEYILFFLIPGQQIQGNEAGLPLSFAFGLPEWTPGCSESVAAGWGLL